MRAAARLLHQSLSHEFEHARDRRPLHEPACCDETPARSAGRSQCAASDASIPRRRRRRVVDRHDAAVHAVAHEISVVADGRRDHRRADGERLEHGVAATLPRRAERKNVCAPAAIEQLAAAERCRRSARTPRRRAPSQARAAVADIPARMQRAPMITSCAVGDAWRRLRERIDQHVMALARNKVADAHDQLHLRTQAERRARRARSRAT